MFAFIVDPAKDPKIELVATLLDHLGYVVRKMSTAKDLTLATELNEPGDHLVIVPENASSILPLRDVIALAASMKNSAFWIYIAERIDPDDYKALVRTGSADWVGWRSSLSEVREICRARRAVRVMDGATSTPSSHVVTTFFGAGGGVGVTTLALETGIHLASQKGKNSRSVAVVDLEPQDSIICDYADLQPRVNLIELAKDPGRLDDYLLEIFTTRHPSGLHIFACDNQRLDPASLDTAAIFALLNRLVEKYDIVVVDAGAHWSTWTEGVIAHSDKVFVVSRYTVPSAKKTMERVARLNDLGVSGSSVAIVVNLCRKDLLGRTQRRPEIDTVFTNLESHYVAADPELATECVDTGESVTQTSPRSAMARDLRKIADAVLTTVPRST
jgi:pilus assembly protein CpaE